MSSLNGKDLISCQEWSQNHLETVLDLAKTLKHKMKIGDPHETLRNKTFFMIFYASSTRTRNSFEAGMTQLGGHAHYLDHRTMRIADPGAFEAIKDTVKVLERYGQGIGVRIYYPTYGQGNRIVREYAKWAAIPVINMETNMNHPCQGLADLMTIKEKIKKYQGKKYVQAWAHSPEAFRVQAVPQENIMLMSRYGMDVVYARPQEFTLDSQVIENAKRNAKESGGTFTETTNLEEACEGADIIYMRNHTTLDFGAIGREAEMKIMSNYENWTLTKELMDKANQNVIFMHCLPADRGHEVMDEVMDGPNSVVYDEAENRLHVQKSLLTLTM